MADDKMAPQSGGMVRQGFGETSMEVRAETASAAVAAQAQATVQARYIVAMQRPRDTETFRTKLMKECQRPGFADAAIYLKPVGKGVEGPSIRFAEACIRLMGNLDVSSPTVYEDPFKRIIRCSVTDLETNATFTTDFVVEKTIERRDASDRQVLGERFNKQGQKVFIVAATEDELLNKVNALTSKAVRTNGLRLVPADIVDEAMRTCNATLAKADKVDPDAAKKRLVDSFSGIGIMPPELAKYLGKPLEQVTPRDLEELRRVYGAIQSGDTVWSEALKAKRPEADGGGAKAPPKAAAAPPAPAAPEKPLAQPVQPSAPMEKGETDASWEGYVPPEPPEDVVLPGQTESPILTEIRSLSAADVPVMTKRVSAMPKELPLRKEAWDALQARKKALGVR